MRERIVQFLNAENISSTQFADSIGVQRSSVSHILSGRNNPSFDFIQKLLKKYEEINAEWLILGVGTMYKSRENRDLFESEGPESVEPLSESKVVKKEDINSKFEAHKKPEATTGQEVERKVRKIVIFYSDNTFSEFTHSND